MFMPVLVAMALCGAVDASNGSEDGPRSLDAIETVLDGGQPDVAFFDYVVSIYLKDFKARTKVRRGGKTVTFRCSRGNYRVEVKDKSGNTTASYGLGAGDVRAIAIPKGHTADVVKYSAGDAVGSVGSQ